MIDADPFNILLNQRCLFSNLSNAKICSICPHVVGKCAVGEIRLSENVNDHVAHLQLAFFFTLAISRESMWGRFSKKVLVMVNRDGIQHNFLQHNLVDNKFLPICGPPEKPHTYICYTI